MKNNIIISKKILITGICIVFLLCCSHTNNDELPVPKIQTGTAKVVGKVANFYRTEGEALPILTLSVPHPVTTGLAYYPTSLNEDGSFFFEVPLECSPIVGFIDSDIYRGGVCLIAGEETQLEIIKNERDKVRVNMKNTLGLTSDDMVNIVDVVVNELITQSTNSLDYQLSPEEFSKFIVHRIDEIMQTVVENNSKLSNPAKQFLSLNYRLFFLEQDLFRYDRKMYMNFIYNPENEGKGYEDFIVPLAPEKSYYAFLKHFNLNNPRYLYADYYHTVLESILNNDTLNIPLIKEMPVKEWLKTVKATMADLAGADSGLFYDMLVANAYSKQFRDEAKPLSEIQKKNISDYFKNQSFTKILLEENDKLIRRAENRKPNSFVTIHKTPSVPKEELINAILSKYEGKIVLIDFWATWCGPCLDAIRKMKFMKDELKDKNIVFVYISDYSSPLGTWEKTAGEIGGEHYYLTEEEWKYVSDSLDIVAIPTYLLYDSNGKLNNKIRGFPGNDKMRTMIEKLM